MRFGAFVPQGWRLDLAGIAPTDHWPTIKSVASAIEAGGFESAWVYDHFHTVPAPTQEVTYEAWTLMASLAEATETVRLGQMCTCNTYRPPSYLAKVAASIDVISGGRLEMGIGAGWYEHEWRAYGYGFPRAGERLAMLREGVDIMRQMWTTGYGTLDGEHYQVDGAMCFPQPLQGTSAPGSRGNGIPMWIAGGGEKKTLRLAAEYADYTNFSGMPDEFSAKSEILAGHCRDIGRDVDEIVRSANFNVVIGRTEAEVQSRLDWIRAHYASAGLPDDVVESTVRSFATGPLVGTPEQIIETLKDMERRGMTYAITYFVEAAYDMTGIQLFEREVLSELVDHEPHRHLWDRLSGR